MVFISGEQGNKGLKMRETGEHQRQFGEQETGNQDFDFGEQSDDLFQGNKVIGTTRIPPPPPPKELLESSCLWNYGKGLG